jgi:hypothetical protein
VRGQQLYDAITTDALPLSQGRKRNTLLDQRDDALAHRFYYHAVLCRLRYDDCLANLAAEFFIDPAYIVRRLALRMDMIHSLKQSKTSVRDLSRIYAHWNWATRI